MTSQSPAAPDAAPAIRLEEVALRFGRRTLWEQLSLSIAEGEYFAVLGPNGSGKSSLLRVLLGQLKPDAGRVGVLGGPAGRGSAGIGYIPQQRAFPTDAPMRARDLVGLGLDGHRWGPGLPGRARRRRIDEMLERVGASDYANTPVGLLSGGEQQRLRVAQALVGRPRLLLADEPLLSLDLHHQEAVSSLIEQYRRESGAAVVLVTHEINPVIEDIDRVLYLANGRFTVGTVHEVLREDVLRRIYGAPVRVVEIEGRYVVLGASGAVLDHEKGPVTA